jgi:hypothetical protein
MQYFIDLTYTNNHSPKYNVSRVDHISITKIRVHKLAVRSLTITGIN